MTSIPLFFLSLLLVFLNAQAFPKKNEKKIAMSFGQAVEFQLNSPVALGPLRITLTQIVVPRAPFVPGNRSDFYFSIQKGEKTTQLRVDPNNAFTEIDGYFLLRPKSNRKSTPDAVFMRVEPKIQLEENVGKEVTIDGPVANTRFGGLIRTREGQVVYIEGIKFWPSPIYSGGFSGRTVRATGVLAKKSSVEDSSATPSFPFTELEPIMLARGQYLLKGARWSEFSE